MSTEPTETPAPNRRSFLRRASVAAAIPTAAVLLDGMLPGAARAAGTTGTTGTPGLPDFAPIPPASLGPALNSNGYYVGQIQGNLYWVTDTFYQAMFLSTREGVVLVDAPPTIGHNLQRAIKDVTAANGRPSQVTHLVYSHSHADHAGASGIFGNNVVRIGHAATKEFLLRDADPNRPAPNITFQDEYTLNVGGETLELAYHGPNHAPDNIYILAPEYQTLMLVDVLYPGWVPFQSVAVSQDIPGWVAAQDVAMSLPWNTLVGGHLGRLGVRADGDIQKQYMADLEASVRSVYGSLDPTPYFQKYGPTGNAWAIFQTFLDAVAENAAAPVISKYTGTLAAADVYTVSNAWTLMESLRIDTGFLGAFGIHP
jgi:glyoxylase-like metal-dependent hydrolase (beta-lactamase superfamily II)